MSEVRITKLEKNMEEMQKAFYRIEASLEYIQKAVTDNGSIKSTVTTHEEKHKVSENRLLLLETNDKEHRKAIDAVNLKIAVATGVWASLMFAAQYFISKI